MEILQKILDFLSNFSIIRLFNNIAILIGDMDSGALADILKGRF